MTNSTPSKKINTKVVDVFHNSLKWVDVNILPLIALPILGVLAADDISKHLKDVPQTAALAVGIGIAALLAVKTHR